MSWHTAFLAFKTKVPLTPFLPPFPPWPECTCAPRCPVYLLVRALAAQPAGFACPPWTAPRARSRCLQWPAPCLVPCVKGLNSGHHLDVSTCQLYTLLSLPICPLVRLLADIDQASRLQPSFPGLCSPPHSPPAVVVCLRNTPQLSATFSTFWFGPRPIFSSHSTSSDGLLTLLPSLPSVTPFHHSHSFSFCSRLILAVPR